MEEEKGYNYPSLLFSSLFPLSISGRTLLTGNRYGREEGMND
ncbi:MAG TPA: hypothetical protein VMW67_07570 [Desulfobacteria bacterium]|nr:hypothetical protein [Desulfobacteria bacterium]